MAGTGLIQNNSAIIANSDTGRIEGLQCVSGSTTPRVGSWIAPNGENINARADDVFNVTLGGEEDPGYMRVELVAGKNLTAMDEGVYTCVIPDENEEEQYLHVGIFLSGFNSTFISFNTSYHMYTVHVLYNFIFL